MKIIALQGDGNTGKTLTIKTFATFLMSFYDIRTAKNYEKRGYTNLSCLQEEINDNYAKIAAKTKRRIKNIHIIVQINGKKIGICSSGDSAHDHVLAMHAFCNENCDFGVFAVRYKSSGKYQKSSGPIYLEQILKCCDKLSIEYIDKTVSANRNDVSDIRRINNEQAQDLFDRIKKLI